MGVRSKNLPVVVDRIVQGRDFSSLDDEEEDDNDNVAVERIMAEIQSIRVARIGLLSLMILRQSSEAKKIQGKKTPAGWRIGYSVLAVRE